MQNSVMDQLLLTTQEKKLFFQTKSVFSLKAFADDSKED